MKVYRKAVRDDYANGNALWTLHESSRSTLLLDLKEAGIGLIILDECHHLLHHWGRVLHQLKTSSMTRWSSASQPPRLTPKRRMTRRPTLC